MRETFEPDLSRSHSDPLPIEDHHRVHRKFSIIMRASSGEFVGDSKMLRPRGTHYAARPCVVRV